MDDYITTDTGTGIYGYLNLETNEIDYVGQTSVSFRNRDQEHRKQKLQISEKFGASYTIIYRRLKKQGINLSKNTSNYYRVSKVKAKTTKQGFTWVYSYSENNKQKNIYCVNFETLKKKVQSKGLPWYKINDR